MHRSSLLADLMRPQTATANLRPPQNRNGSLRPKAAANRKPPEKHNELYQAGHMNDQVMLENHRPPHDVRRNSSHGKRVWRPVYGNNPL